MLRATALDPTPEFVPGAGLPARLGQPPKENEHDQNHRCAVGRDVHCRFRIAGLSSSDGDPGKAGSHTSVHCRGAQHVSGPRPGYEPYRALRSLHGHCRPSSIGSPAWVPCRWRVTLRDRPKFERRPMAQLGPTETSAIWPLSEAHRQRLPHFTRSAYVLAVSAAALASRP